MIKIVKESIDYSKPNESHESSKPRESIPENWIESCRPQLLAYGKSKLPFEVAEDLTQDTLLTAMLKLDSFRGCGKFEHWLLAIFRRKMLDYWKAQKRSHLPSSDLLEIFLATNATATRQRSLEEPCKLLEFAELGTVVEQALCELPKLQTRVMHLSRETDLSSNEIAQRLNVSVQNVWISLHRARKHVQKRVDKYAMS